MHPYCGSMRSIFVCICGNTVWSMQHHHRLFADDEIDSESSYLLAIRSSFRIFIRSLCVTGDRNVIFNEFNSKLDKLHLCTLKERGRICLFVFFLFFRYFIYLIVHLTGSKINLCACKYVNALVPFNAFV